MYKHIYYLWVKNTIWIGKGINNEKDYRVSCFDDNNNYTVALDDCEKL